MRFALILTAVFGGASFAQEDAEVRKELDAQYKKLAEAHDRKDLKTIASLKTPDFHAIFPDGRVGDVVDGKRVDPTKPYDPNAPPYNPDDTR